MTIVRRTSLAALLAASTPLLGRPTGLDPATEARVKAAMETIRQADATRRSVFLTRGTEQGDRYRALGEFRDRRRKAVLDAAEALLSVRGSFPKDEWKAIVAQLSAGGGMPLLVDQAQRELLAVVADPARRSAAAKVLTDLAAEIKKGKTDPESARQKFLSLLEKKSSTRDDFISGLEKVNDAQEKLDDKVVDATTVLQRTLTAEEWTELVRRVSPSAEAGNEKN